MLLKYTNFLKFYTNGIYHCTVSYKVASQFAENTKYAIHLIKPTLYIKPIVFILLNKVCLSQISNFY